MSKTYVKHIVKQGSREHVTSYHGMSNGNSYERCSEPNCEKNKHYDQLFGIQENGIGISNVVSKRINNLITCPTCKQPSKEEEFNVCSNPFHLTVPEGFLMKDGKLTKIESSFDKTGVFTEENFLDLCKRAGLN